MKYKKNLRNNGVEITGLIISTFAFFISIKSCSDSTRALNISLNQSMAFVQVVDAELVNSIDSASFIEVKLTLKNLGLIPARDVKVEFDYGIQIGSFEFEGNSTTRKEIGSIGQGFEKVVILRSNKRNFRLWEIKGRMFDVLYFYGTAFYKDRISDNKEKKVDWCFELKLDKKEALTTKKLNQSDSNRFKSRYSQMSQ
ncbi:MAG: hypothetical protein R3A50_09815 [Saprospiraceae bacterium]